MNIGELRGSLYAHWRPPPDMSVSRWADTHGQLTAESSAEPGRWKSYPTQRAILDAFGHPRIERIVFQKSSRVGWTKIIGHVVGYHIHLDPCPMLLVQPTIDDAESYSKEEIQPMIEATDVLRGLVGEAKSKSSGNTIRKKPYPGGILHIIGANSPRGFRRITVRGVLFDEVDGYPATAGQEGDQIELGVKRSENYWNRFVALGSTPTVKGASRIEQAMGEASVGHYFLSCPYCGEDHIRRLRQPEDPVVIRGAEVPVSHLTWHDGRPMTAQWICPACGSLIDHRHHRSMIESGYWLGEAWDYRDGEFSFEPDFEGDIGFFLWAGYSFSPNATPGRLARDFLRAKNDPEKLRTYVNTVLGETYEEKGESVRAEALSSRGEKYAAEVPDGIERLTAGVDVQDNRLEAEVVGWGDGEESWCVDYVVLEGDTTQEKPWLALAELLERKFLSAAGDEYLIEGMCIDSGFLPRRVYQFVLQQKRSYVWATKGQAGEKRPIVEDRQKRARRIKTGRKGAKPEIIGVDEAKTVILKRMTNAMAPGPGYMHFRDDLPEAYFDGLTAEKLFTKYHKGRAVREWRKIRPRNEPLDCRVMAYAALLLLENDKKKRRRTAKKRPGRFKVI